MGKSVQGNIGDTKERQRLMVMQMRRGYLAVLLSLGLALIPCAASAAPAEKSPVTYKHIVRHDPNMSIYVVTINLNDPRVSVHVARSGPDPDGDGPWLTTLLPPSEVAERDGFDIAVNGDFFDAKNTKDIEGRNTGYIRGKFAAPISLAMSDGNLWSKHTAENTALEIDNRDHASIVRLKPGQSIPSDVRQIVSGHPIIVRHGKPTKLTDRFAITKNPRTAVGLSRDGSELILLVVDGRQRKLSVGMTLPELAQEMIDAGCYTAMNLDGGGSSVLVLRDPATRQLHVINSPSDHKERSVADVLGVKVNAPLPPLPE